MRFDSFAWTDRADTFRRFGFNPLKQVLID